MENGLIVDAKTCESSAQCALKEYHHHPDARVVIGWVTSALLTHGCRVTLIAHGGHVQSELRRKASSFGPRKGGKVVQSRPMGAALLKSL